MKLITILLTTMIMNACGVAKEAGSEMSLDASSKTETQMESSKFEQEQAFGFEYSAITRGSFKQVKISDSQISVQKNRSEKAVLLNCKKEDWDKLMDLMKDIRLENLSKLEAPSKAHQYDGAAIASLTIIKDGKTYQSASFDHGKPPKEIDALVTYILSLSKVE